MQDVSWVVHKAVGSVAKGYESLCGDSLGEDDVEGSWFWKEVTCEKCISRVKRKVNVRYEVQRKVKTRYEEVVTCRFCGGTGQRTVKRWR